MNFFFPFLPLHTPNTALMQYLPISQQFDLQNTYLSLNFLCHTSQVNEPINYSTTMESLNGVTAQKAVVKKKKTALKVKIILF